jgi:hypothetical protein
LTVEHEDFHEFCDIWTLAPNMTKQHPYNILRGRQMDEAIMQQDCGTVAFDHPGAPFWQLPLVH